MKLLTILRYFGYVLTVIAGICLPLSALLAEETAEVQEAKTPANQEQKATLIDIISWATILPKELIDLQSGMVEIEKINAVEKELAVLTKEANEIKKDTAIVQTNSNLPSFQIKSEQNKIYKLTNRLKKLSEPITSIISELMVQKTEWQEKKEQLSNFDKKEMLALALAKEQQTVLSRTIEKALQLIDEQLGMVLAVGKKIGDLQILLYSSGSDLEVMEARLKKKSIQQTSPSIFSAEFHTGVNLDLFQQSYANTKQFVADQLESLGKNRNMALLSLCAFLLVCFGIYKTKTLVTPSSRWHPFALHPLATTIFVASSLNAFINIMPVNFELPVKWEALLRFLVMLASIRLISSLMKSKLRRRVFKRLIIFMAIAMLMVVLDLPGELIRLYVFYVSLFALVYYFYQLPRSRGKNDLERWLRRTLGIFPAAVLFFGISGYDAFALILFSTLLSAIIACLVIWILYLLHFGLIDLLLSVLSWGLIKEQRETILKNLQPIIVGLHLIILLLVEAVICGFFPNVSEAYDEIFVKGFHVLNIHVSPGFFVTVIFIIYGALLTSKAIQMLLLNKILPRFKAEKGVQLSITRLVHYAVLTIGFFIMLNALGFQLSQLALLGGALGVGIGFGLQAIVNNFTSGLILLFERPIKVGDAIRIGTELGEVKNLGLRATIIQTYDNAEIVVPNSDLITQQVTNYTLAERKVRVRVPVGVAYGTEVSKVLDILRACGKANPMVLNTPAPTALFLAFGASSLDFELRVWIPEFLDSVQVLSELNQDIDNEFALNNIEIPFPQSDLHLRSVDETAAARLRGTSVPTQPELADSTSNLEKKEEDDRKEDA